MDCLDFVFENLWKLFNWWILKSQRTKLKVLNWDDQLKLVFFTISRTSISYAERGNQSYCKHMSICRSNFPLKDFILNKNAHSMNTCLVVFHSIKTTSTISKAMAQIRNSAKSRMKNKETLLCSLPMKWFF